MKKTKLHIKNMICPRCETVIRIEMKSLGIKVIDFRPGYATVVIPDSVNLTTLEKKLCNHGFELLNDPESKLIEQLKTAVLDFLLLQETVAGPKKEIPIFSAFLIAQIGKNYAHLSKFFSKHEGRTLESYYIHLRIERVKELLDYGELNVSEIARKLGYSSVHYLSAQFKKVTGMSISDYKKNAEKIGRTYLNRI
ncbi:AraC family transcriptional regulator [Catalinimonas sp. 4WD22]|uniref:AraC family transcriptional regulator n=1 Tax=Catalinimonas locisalis TaxID=3133978 RepID=UPI003100B11F